MRKIYIQILGCMILLHLFSFTAMAANIGDVVIVGNKNVSEDKIRRILRVKNGDPYDLQKVSEGVKRLYATKEFSDIQAHKEERGSLLTLTIEVTEYPKIDKLRFEGSKRIKPDELTEAIAVKEGAFVRPSMLRKDHVTIEDMYREKGYYRVVVTNRFVTEPDKKTKKPQVVLIYDVAGGEKVSVKHIDFFGNRSVDAALLRKVMETKEDRWFRGADFKPKVLDEDLLTLVQLYREFGFLDAEVVNRELIFSKNGKGLDIFVTVKEGPQFKVGKVTWAGNKLFSDIQIRPLISFHEGDVFNDTKFTEMQINLNSLYWDRGYIYNSISPEKIVNGDIIDVQFTITEGKPAHIHEINVSGNTKTSEKVIRRQLTVQPGEVFLRPRLLRSLREVFNLGFFSGPPQVGTSQANENGDINIDLKVEEKQTGQFRLGAGFSALNSISGFIGLAETNFLGKGQTVGIDWEFSRTRQNVDLRFTEPWLMETPTQLSINVFNRVQNQVRQQFYDDRRRGASVRIGRPFPWFDYTSIFWRYSYESIELKNFAAAYTGPLRSTRWPQNTSSMAVTLTRNSTDNPFRATTGTLTTVTAELNGGILGGDVSFQRYEGGFTWHETLFRSFVLSLGFQAAVLDGFESPSQVPDYELFRLGGNRRHGVRGYDFYEIFPEGNPIFLGGRYMNIMSIEVSVPLAPTVYVLGFLDAGNTWNSFRAADPFDLKKGAGVGIRVELPMLGTIGFDYGYGFDKILGPSWEPHLSLGAGF